MTRHEAMVRMRHMLDHAKEAVALMRGKTRTDLDTDRILQLAVVRLAEIVGEAASRVPKDDCVRYPSVPWPQITSLRNRLIHGYHAVDLDILWEIITNDFPPLIAKLEKIVPPEIKKNKNEENK